jgi:hypothetical protein
VPSRSRPLRFPRDYGSALSFLEAGSGVSLANVIQTRCLKHEKLRKRAFLPSLVIFRAKAKRYD